MDSAGFVAFRRSLARGWTFLRRSSGWKLDATGVVAALVLLQLLLVTYAGARMVGNDIVRRGTIRIDIESGTLDQRVQELYAHVRALPSIANVDIVTGEEMLVQEQERDASLGEFLERYNIANPFPDSFVVSPNSGEAYEELRTFIESEDSRGGVAASSLAEIAARENAAKDSLAAVRAAKGGLSLLIFLTIAVTALLSLNLVARIASLRLPAANAEYLAGAMNAAPIVPGMAASVVALLGSLVVSLVLAALSIMLLAAFSWSSVVGGWLVHAVFVGALLSVPAVVAVQAAGLFVIAWMVSAARSVTSV